MSIKNGTEIAFAYKVLAKRIIPELESDCEPELKHDSSTNTLIHRYRGLKTFSNG